MVLRVFGRCQWGCHRSGVNIMGKFIGKYIGKFIRNIMMRSSRLSASPKVSKCILCLSKQGFYIDVNETVIPSNYNIYELTN
jgi:hypothetical protein